MTNSCETAYIKPYNIFSQLHGLSSCDTVQKNTAYLSNPASVGQTAIGIRIVRNNNRSVLELIADGSVCTVHDIACGQAINFSNKSRTYRRLCICKLITRLEELETSCIQQVKSTRCDSGSRLQIMLIKKYVYF